MAKAADLRDHDDKREQRQEQEPDGALEGQNNAGGNDRAHY